MVSTKSRVSSRGNSMVGKSQGRSLVSSAPPSLPTSPSSAAATPGAGGAASPVLGLTPFQPPYSPTFATNQADRKYAELFQKYQKYQARTENENRESRARANKQAVDREKRLERVVGDIIDNAEFAHQIAREVEEREVERQKRVRDRHEQWQERVYRPIAFQIHENLNPLPRMEGAKSVDFCLPGQVFRIAPPDLQDPNRKDLVSRERETSLHKAATMVLQISRSAPELSHCGGMGDDSPCERVHLLPRSRSRAMLDPRIWGEVPIQGTPSSFHEACAKGPTAARGRRSGDGVHLPDESDGVLFAGTRHSRVNGLNDKGILTGSIGRLGETYALKNGVGAGSGAPAQDHFDFATGRDFVDLEIPLGKKTFHIQLFPT